jgi:hypothetical protein
MTTFDSPESAAMSDFPAAHCRVAASASEDDDGYVLLDTNLGGGGYLYGVAVYREDGGWSPGTSGNGPGWTSTGAERDLGTLASWGDAPAGAERVRVRWGGHAGEAPVADGVYLVTWWRVPCPDPGWPVVEFRVHGEWVPGPPV